jgi:hypothetical protein
MYKINSALEPKCTHDNDSIRNHIQLGATGDVRPCNYYGTSVHWKILEEWCEQKGLNLAKLNIKVSTMQEIYDSDVFKAILDGHETLDLPKPCLWYCTKNDPLIVGDKETDKGYSNGKRGIYRVG